MLQLKKHIKAKKQIHWKEVLAGEKAFKQTGNWLPEETLDVIREPPRSNKRTTNYTCGRRYNKSYVALRQILDLYGMPKTCTVLYRRTLPR
jgi:isocitrate dehydrogenase